MPEPVPDDSTDEPFDFGECVRMARRAAGLTQTQVADHFKKLGVSGVSRSYLAMIEAGHQAAFSDMNVIRMAKLLKANARKMLLLAKQSRGIFQLGGPTTDHRRVGALLEAAWPSLGQEALDRIEAVLQDAAP